MVKPDAKSSPLWQHVQRAATRQVVAVLLELEEITRARAMSTSKVVPDGVVPSELPALLAAIGVPGGATTTAAAAVVVAQCRGAHQAQLLGARRRTMRRTRPTGR